MDGTSWGVLGGIVGALVTAVAAAVLKIMAARYQQQRETRIEALAEYKGLVDQLRGQVTALQAEVGKLYEAHTRCREENAELRGELRALRGPPEGHQAHAAEDGPASLAGAEVVTDSGGVITRAGPAALALLGYPEQDLVGRELKSLLPGRLRDDCDRDLARARAAGAPSPGVRAAAGFALARDGVEVPVVMHLRPFD